MSIVSFGIPISFANLPARGKLQTFLEGVDDYFFLKGKKAYVIPDIKGHQAELFQGSSSCALTALKVASYFTIAIPLIMLIAKVVLRSSYKYYLRDSKKESQETNKATQVASTILKGKEQTDKEAATLPPLDYRQLKLQAQEKLEEGINIPPEVISKIQDLMPKLQKLEEDPEITWLGKENNLVFCLATAPQFVFKMAQPGRDLYLNGAFCNPNEVIENRFSNMIDAKNICMLRHLDLLVIPHAKKIEVEHSGQKIALIAEERLNINPEEKVQEKYYEEFSPEMDETLRQLVIFIASSEFSDVDWKNIPILDVEPNVKQKRRIALIDLEAMEGGYRGIYGDHRRGLIGCLFSERQMDRVIELAKENYVFQRGLPPERIKQIRLEALGKLQNVS